MQPISVIIPVLHDEDRLEGLLAHMDCSLEGVEIVVVDGSGGEARPEWRKRFPSVVWETSRAGRGHQMNLGAEAASGDILLFLHADTRLPEGWPAKVRGCLTNDRVALGAFRFRLDPGRWKFRLLELGVRLRCAFRGLPYGDQALFVRAKDFHASGGYKDWPLLEDVEWVERMKKRGRVVTLSSPAVTSARRWQENGLLGQSRTNLSILRDYRRGVPVAELARRYRGEQAAVIVFCKFPEPGNVKTRLAETIGDERAVAAYKTMVDETLVAVSQTLTPATTLVFYHPPADEIRVHDWLGDHRLYVPQARGDLGEKMQSAMEHAFGNGFGRAIVIGTDCPGLKASHLDAALHAMEEKDVVLGPTEDGGYYLIGTKAVYPSLFAGIEWSTPRVFSETMDRVRALRLSVYQLETLRDVDTEEDLTFHGR